MSSCYLLEKTITESQGVTLFSWNWKRQRGKRGSMAGLKLQENVRKGTRSEVWVGRCVPPLQSRDCAESQRPCRRCFSSLSFLPKPCVPGGCPACTRTCARETCVLCPLGQPSCCIRTLGMQSPGADAELKLKVPL